MPPKKKVKAVGGAAAAAPAPAAADAPTQPDLTLTPDGVSQLRALAQHRPHRIPIGGFHLAAAGAAVPPPPPPAPVTLQIVQINRCQSAARERASDTCVHAREMEAWYLTRFSVPRVVCCRLCGPPLLVPRRRGLSRAARRRRITCAATARRAEDGWHGRDGRR